MNQNIENFDSLLFKYRFKNPVSPDMQRLIIKSRKDNLKYILKKTGYYSSLFGFTLFIFYWIRALGIKATLIKSKVIVSVIAVNITASTIIGGHYAAKFIIETQFKQISGVETAEQNEDIAGAESLARKKRLPVADIHFDFGVEEFSGDSVSSKIVASRVLANLRKILGQDRVTSVKSVLRNRVDKLITGSVRGFGKRKFITAKIVNVKNTRVEFVFSEEVSSDNEIDSACLRLSKKIAAKIE